MSLHRTGTAATHVFTDRPTIPYGGRGGQMQPQDGRSVSEAVRGPESVQMQSAEKSRIGGASAPLRLREVGEVPVLVSRGQVQEAAGFVLQWLEYRSPSKEGGKR